jgi:tRNA(Arg) A34 adenosine deaminase TadA
VAKKPTAFLVDSAEGLEKVFFTTHSPYPKPGPNVIHPYEGDEQLGFALDQPFTPYTHLIEGVWNHDSSMARKILRNRIYSPFERTPLCDGMIKVAAKRANVVSQEDFEARVKSLAKFEWIEVTPAATPVQKAKSKIDEKIKGKTLTLGEAVAVAEELSLASYQTEGAEAEEIGVGAVLLNRGGKVLTTAYNQNFDNRTQHAELLLIRNYLQAHGEVIPANSKLIVTLKPCAMCAAQILTFAKDIESLEIIFVNDDEGSFANNTVLIPETDLHDKAGQPNSNMTQYGR